MASEPTYYWDACMFYEVLNDEPVSPEKKEAVNDILQLNIDGKGDKDVIVTSVITHLEVLPKKLASKKAADDDRKYLGMFDGKRFVDIEISRNILTRAREIRDFYYRAADTKKNAKAKMMDAADALHLATASLYGARVFHTRDDDDRGYKIPLVSLYKWSGFDKLCNKYPLAIVSPENDQKVMDLGTTPKAP